MWELLDVTLRAVYVERQPGCSSYFPLALRSWKLCIKIISSEEDSYKEAGRDDHPLK